MIYHIADLQNELQKLIGIPVSLDQLRKLESRGLTLPTRNPKNNYREYTEENFRLSMRNLICYYMNVPIKDILSKDPEVLKKWIKIIRKAICELARTY